MSLSNFTRPALRSTSGCIAITLIGLAQQVRLREGRMAPHFIRRGFYTVVASTVGCADHQEWIVPRSIARCGLDTIASSHQDPACKPCAHSPLHRPQRRYTAHCGRLRYLLATARSLPGGPLRSSATLARKLVQPRSLRYRATCCMLREVVYAVRCTILHAHCGDKHRYLQRVVSCKRPCLRTFPSLLRP
jgi:hypothetical protein